jgi:hypothetical protein
MSIKRTLLASAATLAAAAGTTVLGTLAANAATAECGAGCISVFAKQFGSYAQPAYVEAVLDGKAQVGQPVILAPADGLDPAQDLRPRGGPMVSDFHAAGMVSDEVNEHYGDLRAAQIEFSPLGVRSGLCVGVEGSPSQGEGLTLQSCSTPGTTVFILGTPYSPPGEPRFFPLISGATTNFSRPYTMDYPRGAHPTDDQMPSIVLRHLKFVGEEHRVPERQLFGTYIGVL